MDWQAEAGGEGQSHDTASQKAQGHTWHTAVHTAYHGAGPTASRQALGAQCPSLVSASGMTLFEDRGCLGVTGPGAGPRSGWGGARAGLLCPWL